MFLLEEKINLVNCIFFLSILFYIHYLRDESFGPFSELIALDRLSLITRNDRLIFEEGLKETERTENQLIDSVNDSWAESRINLYRNALVRINALDDNQTVRRHFS